MAPISLCKTGLLLVLAVALVAFEATGEWQKRARQELHGVYMLSHTADEWTWGMHLLA
jgi:hypothetical protein